MHTGCCCRRHYRRLWSHTRCRLKSGDSHGAVVVLRDIRLININQVETIRGTPLYKDHFEHATFRARIPEPHSILSLTDVHQVNWTENIIQSVNVQVLSCLDSVFELNKLEKWQAVWLLVCVCVYVWVNLGLKEKTKRKDWKRRRRRWMGGKRLVQAKWVSLFIDHSRSRSDRTRLFSPLEKTEARVLKNVSHIWHSVGDDARGLRLYDC